MKTREQKVTTWLMWRCDLGHQWATVESYGGAFSLREYDGRECDFSECKPGHVARIVGKTIDREIASEWSEVGITLAERGAK